MIKAARGRFITLEGGEGVGKSTQLSALGTALSALGYTVELTREPGGSAGAEAIRELLLHRAECDWSARSEALLFAAARADHIEKRIRPALERGAWVLCDRFVDSTRAYQGLTGGIADDEIMQLHHIGCQGLMPDRTLVLRLPANEADSRRAQRNGAVADRFEGRDARFHAAVIAAFERLAVQEPQRFRTVDASGDKDAVTARLLGALSDLLDDGVRAA